MFDDHGVAVGLAFIEFIEAFTFTPNLFGIILLIAPGNAC